jgi:hypothetical protein
MSYSDSSAQYLFILRFIKEKGLHACTNFEGMIQILAPFFLIPPLLTMISSPACSYASCVIPNALWII